MSIITASEVYGEIMIREGNVLIDFPECLLICLLSPCRPSTIILFPGTVVTFNVSMVGHRLGSAKQFLLPLFGLARP